MSAPFLWIILPMGLAILLLLLRSSRAIGVIASIFTLLLTLAALLLPIDTVLTVKGLTFKLAPSIEILGRSLTLTSGDRAFLALIYGSATFWFIPAASLQMARRMIPLGLAITAQLVATLAVVPFLYAALFIETAVLLSLPMLATPGQKPGKGLIRFLIFQTLAMPFILFSGWLLAGIGANPGNLALVQQASILLGLGFAFLLAIFPFYAWIPMLMEDAHPYVAGFILWMLPTVTILFGLGFLDQYTWLRDAPALGTVLTVAGALMIITGGILAAFQNHLGRIMGYAVIVETGFSLLALNLSMKSGLSLFLLLFVPRTLSLAIWALALSALKKQAPHLTFDEVKGLGYKLPLATAAVVLANLALAGMPLLAGFPVHQVVWEGMARNSLPLAFWIFLGSLGLFISAMRVLTALVSAPQKAQGEAHETTMQRSLLLVGLLALFLLGLFPQWALPLWTKLPAIFEHLGH